MQKIMTTTAQNTKITKISPNFPTRKSPGKCTVSANSWQIAQKICRDGAQKQNQPNKTVGNQAKLSHSAK